MLPATCVGGVVTAEGVPIPSAEILSEGVGQSEGVVFLDEDEARYVAKITPDLKTTLEKLSDALGSIASALTAIDTKTLVTTCGAGSGTAGPTPVAALDITAINTAKAAVDTLKAGLK